MRPFAKHSFLRRKETESQEAFENYITTFHQQPLKYGEVRIVNEYKVDPTNSKLMYDILESLGVLTNSVINLFVDNIHTHRYTKDGDWITFYDNETLEKNSLYDVIISKVKINQLNKTVISFQTNSYTPITNHPYPKISYLYTKEIKTGFEPFNDFLGSLKTDLKRIHEGVAINNPNQKQINMFKLDDYKKKLVRLNNPIQKIESSKWLVSSDILQLELIKLRNSEEILKIKIQKLTDSLIGSK